MTHKQRAWTVLIALAFAQIFMFGPTIATIGVFLTPLVKEFGWSGSQAARLATATELGLGVASITAGWLIDRLDARWVMTVGALLAGAGFLTAASSHSLALMTASYVVIGAGVAFCGMVPSAYVCVNWFPTQRGLAVAVTLIGSGIGLALAPRLTTLVIARAGWRTAMTAIGLPMLLLSAPAVAIFIRARPLEAVSSAHREGSELAGVDTPRALASSAFWIILGFSLLAQLGVGAVYFHTVPYLITGAGYTPATASLIFGGQALLFGPGALLLGMLADRFGPKAVLFASYALLAGSVASLLAASNHALGFLPVIFYGVLWGVDMGNAAAMPTLLAETFGMRRFGTISGLGTLTVFVGQGLGPIITGTLLDRTKSYAAPFEIAIGLMLAAAAMTTLVYPVEGHDRVPEKAHALSAASAV